MSLSEIATMINSIGLPFAYRQFDAPQTTPFIVYYYDSNEPEPADNVNYVDIENLVIELYTDNKDFVKEKAIEDVLKANELAFEKNETYISNEKMYMITYESEVIING